MTPRQRLIYKVCANLVPYRKSIQTKEQCKKAVEELLSEHTEHLSGETVPLGNQFDALNCNFGRFCTSVWAVWSRVQIRVDNINMK